MSFTYQMVEKDAQELYETLDEARRKSFYFYTEATQSKDAIAETFLKDLAKAISNATVQLADMNRKIESLKKKAEENGTI